MRLFVNNDAYANASSIAMISTVPFITLGLIDCTIVAYIAAVVGFAFLCFWVVRSVQIVRGKTCVPYVEWVWELVTQLSLPYVLALSALIAKLRGFDPTIALWFALALTVLSVAYIALGDSTCFGTKK